MIDSEEEEEDPKLAYGDVIGFDAKVSHGSHAYIRADKLTRWTSRSGIR